MKLVILGTNGRTGKHLLREALDEGLTVTAVVRSDAKRPRIKSDRLKVVVGDPSDPQFLSGVFRGQDAVVSTLGGRSPTKQATSIYWKSADAIVQAAWDVGLRKVAVMSSALLFPRRRLFEKLLATAVPNVIRNAGRMELRLFEAKLDVIVVRCGFLREGEKIEYRAERGSLPEHPSAVSRKSVARFLVETVQEPWSGCQIFGVCGPAS